MYLPWIIGAITTTTVAIVTEYCGILPPIAALAGSRYVRVVQQELDTLLNINKQKLS